MFVPSQNPLGQLKCGMACFPTLSLGSLTPLGTAPWKLSDNSGHFEFFLEKAVLIWRKQWKNYLKDIVLHVECVMRCVQGLNPQTGYHICCHSINSSYCMNDS